MIPHLEQSRAPTPMRILRLGCLLLVAALLVPSGPLHGQGREAEPPSSQAERAFRSNHLSVLAGGTTQSGRGRTTSFAVGVDYVRRFSRVYGLGVTGEWVPSGNERDAMLAVLFDVWLSGGLVLAVGPGVEFADLSDTDGESETEDSDSEAHGAARVGLSYFFQVGDNYTITPTARVDLVSGREAVWVWGATFGVAF